MESKEIGWSMIFYFLGFIALITGLLALDLGVFHRKDEAVSAKAAVLWTVFWILLALVFNGLVYLFYESHFLGIGTGPSPANGLQAAIAFFTAYVVEKSLSIDNIFVIALIFNYFRVPAIYQHRILFWGILGALVMRGAMIAAGIAAISYFSWLTYALGALLIITAVRMMVAQEDNLEPENNLLIRLVERRFTVVKTYFDHRFFIKIDGRWAVTPLFLALVLIETSDLFFAIDSIPAVLAITLDPFIVFTSNVFAILGMRSLYFALASFMDSFRYLKTSLIFILGFVGTKMILAHHLPIDPLVSLATILSILILGIVASLLASALDRRKGKGKRSSFHLASFFNNPTVRMMRKVFIVVIGSTIFLAGLVMLFLPGPGLLLIFLGLGLLAIEFVWARVWIKKIKKRVKAFSKKPSQKEGSHQKENN